MTSFLLPLRCALAVLVVAVLVGCDTPSPSDPAPVASSNALGGSRSAATEGTTGQAVSSTTQAGGGSTSASAPTVSTGR